MLLTDKKYYIGCDKHKRYSTFAVMDERGCTKREIRVENSSELLHQFYQTLPSGSPIAVETTGSWYWFVDRIEGAGHIPFLVHAGKAKLMMGHIHKTDKLDALGLAKLLRNGTLPTVWIPPREIRDTRELLRTRMVFSAQKTRMKNGIHAILSKYGVVINGVSDLFGKRGRERLLEHMDEFPPLTRGVLAQRFIFLDQIEAHMRVLEDRIGEILEEDGEMRLLMTLPGVGKILSCVIACEVGDVDRFPGPSHFASYSGLVPVVRSSGGKTYYGRSSPASCHFLRWAFVEAAGVISIHHKRWPDRHFARTYRRLRAQKGHGKAVVAVARRLAEATYWMLKKKEAYREPTYARCSSGRGVAKVS